MISYDSFTIYGHHNVLALHRTTLEFTKENYLTPRGDCILGINSTKAIKDLNEKVKEILKNNGYGYVILKVGNYVDIIKGVGNENLSFSNEIKMIIRKSTFISDSTLLIKADKSARDINRNIVNLLKQGNKGLVTIIASDIPLKDEEIFRIFVNLNPPS
ncbi:DUF371 domain-containing protein [Acidianus sulfidivorans JP7]|uniref:DUF371 domain-containing protein n=1 Tax=Acidianus sulfidivorans JP7 TaxID=619593 RepID=A0A2U9IKI8_9CREN|nr:DUF371 domain-containing protein [Acidianus sulfidivorans]AWR96548.1 DUF371 domain-containing protein [Acidianus sulfidivorans JP7]